MELLASVMEKETAFLEIMRINGEIPTEKYLYMKEISDRFTEIIQFYDFPTTIFGVFRNSDIFVSNNQVAELLSKYYGSFVEIEGMDDVEFREALLENALGSGYLTADNFYYFLSASEKIVSMENAVLFIQPVGQTSYWGDPKGVIVFVLDSGDLLNFFLTEEMQEDTILLLTDGNGGEILSYGEDVEELKLELSGENIKVGDKIYQVFQYDVGYGGWKLMVGYSSTSIVDQTYEIGRLLLIYVICGGLLAILLTVVSTVYAYRPFGRMLDEVSGLGVGSDKRINEYDYVRESLLKLVSDKDEMETRLLLSNAEKQAVTLERIFSTGFTEQGMKEDFVQNFPFCGEGYYMVRVMIKARSEEEGTGTERSLKDTQTCLLYASEVFEKEGEYHFLQIWPGNGVTVWLVADEERAGTEHLLEILKRVRELVTEAYMVQFIAGVSQRQEHIEKISVAYAQARQTVNVYRESEKDYVEIYQRIYGVGENCFEPENLQKVYGLILAGRRGDVEEEFTRMKEEVSKAYETYGFQKYEIYYTVNHMLNVACQKKGLKDGVSALTFEELKNMTLLQCLEELGQNAGRICDSIEYGKRVKNTELRRSVDEYMEQNFKRVELTVTLTAQELGISEKYVYSIVKEETGKTFSVYLDELRVEYARECLEKTDWSNERIAGEAGFGAVNSFYRVFKKYTGMSPGAYRSSRTEN